MGRTNEKPKKTQNRLKDETNKKMKKNNNNVRTRQKWIKNQKPKNKTKTVRRRQ